MVRYSLVLDRRVRSKDLRGLPKAHVKIIVSRIEKLTINPRPPESIKLTDQPGYRVCQGDYRILYVVDDLARNVRVLAVLHRREAYR